MTVPAIRLSQLVKSFGPVQAVDGVDLEIDEGEFFSMLGHRDRARRPCCA